MGIWGQGVRRVVEEGVPLGVGAKRGEERKRRWWASWAQWLLVVQLRQLLVQAARCGPELVTHLADAQISDSSHPNYARGPIDAALLFFYVFFRLSRLSKLRAHKMTTRSCSGSVVLPVPRPQLVWRSWFLRWERCTKRFCIILWEFLFGPQLVFFVVAFVHVNRSLFFSASSSVICEWLSDTSLSTPPTPRFLMFHS